MIAEPSHSNLGAVPVCVCPAMYQRVSHDLTQKRRGAVLMRTAAGTIGSLCVQCTVLGASLMIWWIFQVYPARKLAFRCDSVLPRVRACPSRPFVLFV